MRSWLKHPVRVTGRLLWLILELAYAAFSYMVRCAFRRPAPAVRAGWLQDHSCRVLRVFDVDTQTMGEIPRDSLLVSNHLSYLDILVFAGLSHCLSVAKSDVRDWPVFGWFARIAGTVFVDRVRRTQAAESVDEIEEALKSGMLVILFPEGTSSGGETVLPFKSALLEPAVRKQHSVTAALLQYDLPDGVVSEDVCYWKDMTLVPHIIKLLSKRAICASVRFTRIQNGGQDRKELARQLHSEVLKLKDAPAH